MIRSFVVCGAVLFLACTAIPLGQCEDDSDCLPGLSCAEGVCVGCGGDGDCQAWQACNAERRCALREGMCETNTQCRAWEACGTGHTCELAEGSCLSQADCYGFEDCNTSTNQCVLQAGRCRSATNCTSGSFWTPTCDEDNWCRGSAPGGNDVLMWGTLNEGTCGYDAISSVLSPTLAKVGFTCQTTSVFKDARVSPNGRVIYADREMTPQRLKYFVPDDFRRERDLRFYPTNGTANDTRIPTPKCDPDQDIGKFVVQAGTGAIVYSCGLSPTGTYYDAAGEVVSDARHLLAWNSENYLLENTGSRWGVVTPARAYVPVTGMPQDDFVVAHARAHPTGFRVVLSWNNDTWDNSEDDVQQLWHITNEGVASLVVTYGAFPAEVWPNWGGVLDGEGTLYAPTFVRDSINHDEVVVKRPVDGSAGTVIYRETDAPASVNYSANYDRLFNFMHGGYLFTGP